MPFLHLLTSLADSFTCIKKQSYCVPGQKYEIVRVPMFIQHFGDIGHICMVITNHDNTQTSFGFYPQNYLDGLNASLVEIFRSHPSVVVSPDPLLNKARKDPFLNNKVVVVHEGVFDQRQANHINILTFSDSFTVSGNISKITGIPEGYMTVPFIQGNDNCVTWISKLFPITRVQ